MQPHDDDQGVADDEVLYRRLHPNDVVAEGGAFRTRQSDGLSVYRAKLIELETIERQYPKVGIARITVAQIRSVGEFKVLPDPINDDPQLPDDPSQALIIPLPSRSQSQKLAALAELVKLPEIVEP